VACGTSKSGTYTLEFSLYKEEGLSAKELLGDPEALAKAKLIAITWEPSAAGTHP
jgi:hypothetical protein